MGSVLKHFVLIKDWLRGHIALQAGHGFLWWPVMLGAGIALYFALPQEPNIWLAVCVLAGVLAGLYGVRAYPRRRFAVFALFLCCLGFTTAHVRALSVRGPVIEHSIDFVDIKGRVVSVEPLSADQKSARLILDQLHFEGLDSESIPVRVRLSVRSKSALPAYDSGDIVAGLASVHTPSDPVIPGGFDFRRHLYFQRIGGIGFFYGAPAIVNKSVDKWSISFFESLRNRVNARISSLLPEQSTAVVQALLTGKRGAISDTDMEAMRISGLAHMLAISGLHVGLFSAVVFFFVRLSLALVPYAALHWPLKKIAAIAAFVAACLYMGLAGATLPTQRAVIMVGIVLLAVLLDRAALSMRLVAVAALVVLLIAPESLLSISFQLSFAAVIGLIAVYDGLRAFLSAQMRKGGFVRRAALYIGGVMLTSLVAGLVTAPFALYAFQRVAFYGVLANMLAMPVMSAMIMPAAVLALFLMPFGLEAPFLYVMGQGVESVLRIAHAVAEMDHAQILLPALPFSALLCFSCGALFICLWRGPLRWLGLLGLFAGVVIAAPLRVPDVLVAQGHDVWGYAAAAQNGDEEAPLAFYVSSTMKARFERENWSRAYGLGEKGAQHWRAGGRELSCDDMACRLILKGKKVSFVMEKEVLSAECAWADILITRRSVRASMCAGPSLIIDHWRVKNTGAQAVYIDDGGLVVETAKDEDVSRLWRP